MAQLMPWDLDKPVQQPGAAAPWEMDAPVQAAQPVTEPAALPVQPQQQSISMDQLFGAGTTEAMQPAVSPITQALETAPYRGEAPVDSRPLEQLVADADPTGERALRSNAYMGQNVRKGLVDLGDMIVDPLLFNFDLAKNGLFGNADPSSVPLVHSTINNAVDDIMPTVADDSVSPHDRLVGAAVRGATSAATGGLALKAAGAPAYAANAGKVLSGDTLAGAGSGLMAQGYDEYMPDSVKEAVGPLGQILAAVLGGVSGATVNSAGHSIAERVADSAKDKAAKTFGAFTDPSIPTNTDTGVPFKPSDVDMAARIAQRIPSNADQTVANIARSKQELAGVPSEAMPTTGMLADDIGMAMNENVARVKNPQAFSERDAARNAFASRQIDTTVPAGAEGRDMVGAMTKQYDDTLGLARSKVDAAKQAEAAGAEDIVKQNAALKEAQLRQGQASSALDAEFRAKNEAATAVKNEKYAAVADDTPIATQPLYEELMAIENSVPRAARVGTDYATGAKRIRDLITETDPETGQQSIRDLTYGDAKVLKTEISAMRQDAVASGRDVSQLDKLNGLLSGVIDEVNPEAKRYFAEEFAPKFRTGKAGEYSQALKRANKTGEESSATRPSDFGQKFLTKPEDANALQRAVDVNGNPVTAQNATEWMMGDLAKSNVLGNNAEVRFDKFKQWAGKNKGVIDQFPEMRKRIDSELARAEQGGRISKQLGDQVKAAEQNLNVTETDLRRSSLQKAIGNNPKNTISSIMDSGDPETQMADLVGRIKSDPKAKDGLKDAMRQWLRDEAGTTSKNVGQPGTFKYSRAKMDKLFREHEKTLTKVYSPEEMNTLRRMHKVLDVAANLDVKSTKDSAMFERFLSSEKGTREKGMRMLEVALKAHSGVLTGGGQYRTLRLLFDAIGTGAKANRVERIVTDMWFNPDLAQHLLTRNVKEIGTPAWNSKLNRLLAVASGNRDDDDVEDNDQKGSTK